MSVFNLGAPQIGLVFFYCEGDGLISGDIHKIQIFSDAACRALSALGAGRGRLHSTRLVFGGTDISERRLVVVKRPGGAADDVRNGGSAHGVFDSDDGPSQRALGGAGC